ncbi:MAG: HEAT repeat domain-containing protein, partial [Nitrososphaerales archaeon]
MSYEKISEIFESGTKEEKIYVLESFVNTNDPLTINKIISKLDDFDIEVRGEAFSSLVLNE